MPRIALIRTANIKSTRASYNIQELGIALQLAKRGYDVDVYLLSSHGEGVEPVRAEREIRLFWLNGIPLPGGQVFFPHLLALLKANSYDLIQGLDHSTAQNARIGAFCRRRGIPFLLWQGMYEDFDSRSKRAVQFVYDHTILPALRGCTRHTLYKTSSARGYLVGKGFPDGPVLPVGLDTSNFDGAPEIDYDGKYGLPSGATVFLYIGQVNRRKNPIFTLDVFRALSEGHPERYLFFVGRGPMLEEAKAYAEEKGIARAIFIDFIPQRELPALYRRTAMMILPSINEIFGMVILEAMYFGTPVIAYCTAGATDIIRSGVDGLVMDRFDVGVWARQIEERLDEHTVSLMRKSAAESIGTRFTWEVLGDRYAAVYEDILSGERH